MQRQGASPPEPHPCPQHVPEGVGSASPCGLFRELGSERMTTEVGIYLESLGSGWQHPHPAMCTQAPAAAATPSWSCRPIPEPGPFPGIVTRSSCVWLQTEQEREPGARVCVLAVAQATRGQPGAAKTAGGQAHSTVALGGHGQLSLLPPGWVSGQRGSRSVPLNTTRLGASVRTGFYCRAGLQCGSAASFGLFGLQEGSGRAREFESETFANDQQSSPRVNPGARLGASWH